MPIGVYLTTLGRLKIGCVPVIMSSSALIGLAGSMSMKLHGSTMFSLRD